MTIHSCEPVRNTNVRDYPGRQIIIGSGGGATGQWSYRALRESGELFIQEPYDTMYRYMKKIHAGERKSLFMSMESIAESQEEFDHPGNMTYLLIYQNGSRIRTFRWGDPAFSPPSEIATFYQTMMSIINN